MYAHVYMNISLHTYIYTGAVQGAVSSVCAQMSRVGARGTGGGESAAQVGQKEKARSCDTINVNSRPYTDGTTE